MQFKPRLLLGTLFRMSATAEISMAAKFPCAADSVADAGVLVRPGIRRGSDTVGAPSEIRSRVRGSKLSKGRSG